MAIFDTISWRRSLGVYLAQGRLTLTALATTPLGAKVYACFSQSLEQSTPGEILTRWLHANLSPSERRGLSVCIGLGPEQTFYSTRSCGDTDPHQVTLDLLLPEMHAGSPEGDTTAADFLPFKFAGQTLYNVSACQRRMAEELLAALSDAGVGACCLGPAPWYILDTAHRTARPPRNWKTFVNVLLSDSGGLGILIVEGRPILWRRFATVESDRHTGIASAVQQLKLHALGSLGIAEIDGVFVQGQCDADLPGKLTPQLQNEVVFKSQASIDNVAYSAAMAREATSRHAALDLFRTLRPPPSTRELLPRKLAAAMIVGVTLLGLAMYNQLSEVQASCDSVRLRCLSYPWASDLPNSAIKVEHEQLKLEVGALQEFLSTRIIWSDYLRDLPTRLPQNAALQSFQGAFEMNDINNKSAQRRVNRSLTLRCQARFTDRSSAPQEIDAFLNSLRGVELLQRDFPLVGLAEIKWRKEGAGDVALFTVVAMPRQRPAPADRGEK